MLSTIKDIILINAYWFSLPLIGYSILRFIKATKRSPIVLKDISNIALKQHPFIVFLLGFTVTAFFYALISVFFYIFHLPVYGFVIIYLAALSLSVIFLTSLLLRNLFKISDTDFLRLKNQTLLTKILFITLVIILLADFLISIYIKSNVGGDTIYHMSRVVDILSNGFNIQSSFFNNLPEGAYHFNVIYAFYAIPSAIFNMSPIRVWEYSLGFFRFLQWLVIFTLSIRIFGSWLKDKSVVIPLSILSVISAVAFYANKLFIATYPNKVVIIWLILLVICLSYYGKKYSKAVGLVSVCLGLLITMTHPSYALIAVCFIVLLVFVRLVVENKKFISDKSSMITYAITSVVLMLGPIVTKLMPVRLTSSLLNLNEAPLLKIFGMYIKQPDIIPTDFRAWVTLIMGISATFYLLYKLRNRKSLWSIVFALSSFYILVAYVPPIFTILRDLLPVWVISSFYLMNVLEYVFVALGVYGIFSLVGWLINKKIVIGKEVQVNKFIYLLSVILIITLSAIAAPISYKALIADRNLKKDVYSRMEQTAKDFKSTLNNEKVVVTSADFSYYISSLFPIDVVAVTFGHTTLASDGADRSLCLEHIMKSFSYYDLKTVNARNVMINDSMGVKNIIDSKPYLKFIKRNQDFYLYEFESGSKTKSGSGQPYEPCVMYQKKEKI